MCIGEVEPYCDEIEYDAQEKFDAETIARLFAENGFKDIVVSGYGIMYDLLDSIGLVSKMASYMKELSKAEATISRFLDPLRTEMLFLTCKSNSTIIPLKAEKCGVYREHPPSQRGS